ncbi:MAG: hypothetical protein ACYTDY_06285 [Planctomycetota bacterium]|jgi:hypothetical protein
MKRCVPILLLLLAPAALAQQAPSPGPVDPDARLRAVLEKAKADATRVRGLPFLADLAVRKITREQFKEQMLRDVRRVFGEGRNLEHMEKLLQMLRILPEGKGIIELTSEFFPSTVAANYDPLMKRISFLRGYRNEKALRSVMVHELTHALQDQHFNLNSLVFSGELTFDRLLALGALAEGDAEATQQTFDKGELFSKMPLPLVKAFGEAQAKSFLERTKGFPWGVARPFIFQYVDGIVFVESVKRAKGGLAAVNGMYRDPPVTTEQIFHPEKYLDRDRPTRILPPDPPAGYRVLVSNVLGELGAYIVLKTHLVRSYAPEMAAGWDGDRILLLEAAGRPTLLAWYTTWDTARDAEEFAAAAKKMFTIRRPNADLKEVQGKGHVLQTDGENAHAIVRRGADVLVAEGLPREGFAEVLNALRSAKKETLVLERSDFGTGR